MTNEPIVICNVIIRAWFVRHRHYLQRMKTFVLGFVFVFVLANEQAITAVRHTDECEARPLRNRLTNKGRIFMPPRL